MVSESVSSTSTPLVSQGIIQPTPPPATTVYVAFQHYHTIDIPSKDHKAATEAINTLSHTIISNMPGQVISRPQHVPNDISLQHSPLKEMYINVNGTIIRYTADSLPEPPTLYYRTKDDLEKLVRDWDSWSELTINGTVIPLCLWQRLYKSGRPKAWKCLKDQWIKYRFIVGGFRSFSTPAEFWKSMSLETVEASSTVSFKSISQKLRVARVQRDKADTALAREEFGAEFDSKFSYLKNGRKCVFEKEQRIARHYRSLKGISVYWDTVEDEDLELNEN